MLGGISLILGLFTRFFAVAAARRRSANCAGVSGAVSAERSLRIASPLEFKPLHKEIQIDGATKLDDIALERVSNSDLLPATQEIESQMSGAELVWNLGGTAEEKRAFRGCASGCN